MEQTLKEILKHTRAAKRTAPMCPIHASAALQHIANLQASLNTLASQLHDGIESNKH